MSRIKHIRLSRKLTLKQVAEKVNISANLLSHYENQSINMSVPNLIKLADYYCVSTDYILDRF